MHVLLLRYGYYDDLHHRLEACRLGALLLAGAFANSLIHPQRALDFATYTPRYYTIVSSVLRVLYCIV